MRLIIISGMSGSGKSVALHELEDLDFYCIDNLPIGMLPALSVQILSTPNTQYENFAVGIDVRNLSGDLSIFPELISQMRNNDLHCDVIFLDADDKTSCGSSPTARWITALDVCIVRLTGAPDCGSFNIEDPNRLVSGAIDGYAARVTAAVGGQAEVFF